MPCAVTQFQVLSRNPDALAKFYAAAFGWTVNDANAMGYRAIAAGGGKGVPGGIWPCPPEGHPLTQLFVETDDIAGTVEAAKLAGAKVLVPPQTLPDGDQMALILDPENQSIGIFKPRVTG